MHACMCRESADFVSRLQSDSIWVVVLEKLRQGLGCESPPSSCCEVVRVGMPVCSSASERPLILMFCKELFWACRDGMMEQLERFLLVASGDELTGERWRRFLLSSCSAGRPVAWCRKCTSA